MGPTSSLSFSFELDSQWTARQLLWIAMVINYRIMYYRPVIFIFLQWLGNLFLIATVWFRVFSSIGSLICPSAEFLPSSWRLRYLPALISIVESRKVPVTFRFYSGCFSISTNLKSTKTELSGPTSSCNHRRCSVAHKCFLSSSEIAYFFFSEFCREDQDRNGWQTTLRFLVGAPKTVAIRAF